MNPEVGWWRNHPYVRRSVDRDIEEFVGWEKIMQLPTRYRGNLAKRNMEIYATAFLTGGRIEDVLSLRKENFQVTKEDIVVRNMSLNKRYEKMGEDIEVRNDKPRGRMGRLYKQRETNGKWQRRIFETRKIDAKRRVFSFPAHEPLAAILIGCINRAESLLFTGRKRGLEGELRPLSYIRAYQVIDELGIYPHWLRGQRASCLVAFHGMTMEQMMEWMSWEELSTARKYAKMGWHKLRGAFQTIQITPEMAQLQKQLGEVKAT